MLDSVNYTMQWRRLAQLPAFLRDSDSRLWLRLTPSKAEDIKNSTTFWIELSVYSTRMRNKMASAHISGLFKQS